MPHFNSIHIPHFQHFSARRAIVLARDQLSEHETEILMTVAILCGLLIAWTFWAVVVR